MAKLTTTPINSRYGSIDALNDNFDAIETAIENTLSRDGTTPNEMEANLDMNGYSILNAGSVSASSLTLNGVTFIPTNDGSTVTTGQVTYIFTATGGQTDFDVSPYTPGGVSSVYVFVNGLCLSPNDISIDGSNVVLPALEANDEVTIVVLVEAIDSTALYNMSAYVPVSEVTDDYTITSDDFGSFISVNSADPTTITIPAITTSVNGNSGASFILCQKGAGQVTVAAGVGVTLTSASSLKTRAQYSVLGVQCVALNVWRLFGDME
jgi:hypothetical protein